MVLLRNYCFITPPSMALLGLMYLLCISYDVSAGRQQFTHRMAVISKVDCRCRLSIKMFGCDIYICKFMFYHRKIIFVFVIKAGQK